MRRVAANKIKMRSIFSDVKSEFFAREESLGTNFKHDKPELEIMLGRESGNGIAFFRYRVILPYLIEINASGDAVSVKNLMKSIFDPFIEIKEDGTSYGFTIDGQMYSTENETTLNIFQALVKSTSILTNIEFDYVFLKRIGKGSTSSVYLAQNILTKAEFAVKCVKKENLVSFSAIESLFREIRILRKIRHPSICKLFYVYENDDEVFLVLEFVSECSLLKLLVKNKKFSELQTQKLIKNLLQVLDYLNQKEIVHRDIKLENIMISNKETLDIKLIDFGIAYYYGESQLKKCGSPGYMAPEILRNEAYDCKIDIFSTGVVMYVLLHGCLPFESKNMKDTLNKNLNCEQVYDSRLSNNLLCILDEMLSPSQELRPSAYELLSDPWFNNKHQLRVSSTTNISSIDFTP